MNIVIAPDSFKESLSAAEVAATIKEAFQEIFPNAKIFTTPLADGGEGTSETLIYSLRLDRVEVVSEDPLGRPLTGVYGFDAKTKIAYIDIATCSGLPLLQEHERDPLRANTYGTGIIIKNALELGAKHIYLGLGGSATNDAGIGILKALGVMFKNKLGHDIPKCINEIGNIAEIALLKETLAFTKNVKMTILSDVQNPLYGDFGASKIFARQKGANEQTIQMLDDQLLAFCEVVNKMGLKIDPNFPGMGAAGGAAFGLSILFPKLEILPGIDVILQKLEIENLIKHSHLVITAEGKLDNQTLLGKAPLGVAKMAKKYNVPVIAFSGILGAETDNLHECFDAYFPIIDDISSLDQALKNAKINLKRTSLNVARLMRLKI